MLNIFFVVAVFISLIGSVADAPFVAEQINMRIKSFDIIRTNQEESGAVTGEVSDSHCEFKHMESMKSAEDCVLHCLRDGAKPVLIDREKRVVYRLDEEGQKQAQKFAGQRVKASGHVMENMIHVEKIERAK